MSETTIAGSHLLVPIRDGHLNRDRLAEPAPDIGDLWLPEIRWALSATGVPETLQVHNPGHGRRA